MDCSKIEEVSFQSSDGFKTFDKIDFRFDDYRVFLFQKNWNDPEYEVGRKANHEEFDRIARIIFDLFPTIIKGETIINGTASGNDFFGNEKEGLDFFAERGWLLTELIGKLLITGHFINYDAD